MKELKTKEERLAECIHLLKQLKENGVHADSISYHELKSVVSKWVSDGVPLDITIPFPDYGRVAELSLPRYNNKSAGINFKVKRAF
jgi:hypothetical protein